MPQVIVDLLADQRVNQDADGYKVTRTAVVTGLTGSAAQKAFAAINASGIPALGDTHPFIPDIVVTSRSCEMVDGDKARVTLNYAQATPEDDPTIDESDAQISVGSSLTNEERTEDIDGNEIGFSVWNGKVIPVVDTTGRITGFNPVVEFVNQPIQFSIPRPVLRFQRKEVTNPLARANTYVNTVNSTGIWGGAARTWLCSRLDANSNDGGLTYDVTYEFMYDPDSWDFRVKAVRSNGVYPTEETAKPGEDTGNTFWEVYSQTNFGSLNLPNP